MIEALRLRSFGFESAAAGYLANIPVPILGSSTTSGKELLPWYPTGCRARRAGSVDRGRVRSRPAVSVDRLGPVCLAPGQR